MRATEPHPQTDERGLALVAVMLVLITLSLVALLLMRSVNTETRIAATSLTTSQALNVAEAGVGEICSRLGTGDLALPPDNPAAVAEIFLVPEGAAPHPRSADTLAFATRQPAGAWLSYSTAAPGPDVLTCEFKKNALGQILYYDPGLVPPTNTTGGMPIYKVTSTGRVGGSRARIVTEIARRPILANVRGAIQSGSGVAFEGSSDVCGYNHALTTPAGARWWAECSPSHTGTGDLPAGWATGTISKEAAAGPRGMPSWRSERNAGCCVGPWEVVGMSAAEFWSWIGPPRSVMPDPPTGLLCVDDDGVPGNASASATIHGGAGEGMLYVDGDLTIDGDFRYRGLLYVEGDLDMDGACWILGAVVVRGKARVHGENGVVTLLYSSDALMQALSRAGGSFLTLSWRQL